MSDKTPPLGTPAWYAGMDQAGTALADFYAPGLTADTYVDRAFALTSRLLRFSLNSHGVIERKTGVLTATFDTSPPGLADAFGQQDSHG